MRDTLFILFIFLLIILAAVVPVLLVIGPQLDFQLVIPRANITEPPEEEPAAPLIDQDMQRYFELKNESCDTLSEDFLIATNDYSEGLLHDLLPVTEDERMFAQSLAHELDHNLTTRTYLRGDQMKKVISANGVELTTIWKNGRIYTCTGICQMRLMDDDDSEEYYDTLDRMRNNCRYLGKTRLPESLDPALLLDIEKAGSKEINGFRCEEFRISGNSSYMGEINRSSLDPDQSALIWALEHLEGPLTECLDESTGIIVQRNLTLDLTDSYNLEFDAGGYMHVLQTTTLTYFTDEVPEEFLALPS